MEKKNGKPNIERENETLHAPERFRGTSENENQVRDACNERNQPEGKKK
jgi:hypothetical protein